MKRLVIISLVLCLSLSFFVMYSPEAHAEKTITFLHRWPNEPFKGFFDYAVEEFKKEHPDVEFKVLRVLNEDYKQKINVLLASENPPDIFFTWVGEYGNKFIREGIALDLSKYYEEDSDWANNIIPSTVKPFTYKDKEYGVPILMDVRMMAYNKDIFNELNLETPDTWDQLIDVSKKLKNNGYIPLGCGNKAPWNGALYVTTLNQRVLGLDTVKEDYNRYTGDFEETGYVEALERLETLIPYMNKYPNAVSREEERSMFVNGQIAMMALHTIEFPYVKDMQYEWGTFNFPEIEEGKGDPSVITGAPEGFMISKETEHPEIAMEFLKFMTTPEMGKKWVEMTNVISTTKGAVNENNSTPLMVEVIKEVEKAQDMSIWLDTATDAKIFQPYLAGIQQVLNKEKTPQQVMEEVRKAADELRKEVE